MPDVYLIILTDSIVNSFEAIFFKRIDYDYFMRNIRESWSKDISTIFYTVDV